MQKSPSHIKLTLGIKECIELFFRKILEEIETNEYIIDQKDELDYVKMRRFLLTAYNDLLELDFNFETSDLTEIKNRLNIVYSKYLFVKNETKFPKRSYEKIFLSRQIEYKKLFTKVKSNNIEISTLETKIKSTELLIENIKQKIKSSSRLDGSKDELQKELKHAKTMLVDAIHKKATLSEENQLLIQLTDEFYNSYYDEFISTFQNFSKENILKLATIQNRLAYKFDTLIWEKANRSKTIKRFFRQAGIIEEFSSVTFLKYYLKRLDDKKLSLKHKELKELLKYLESLKKNVILCLDDDIEFLNRFKESVYSINRENIVITTTQAGEAVNNLKSKHPNIFIINPSTRRVAVRQILKYIKNEFPYIRVLFFSNNITKDELTLAKEFDIEAILKKSFSKDTIQKELLQILDKF